MHLHTVALGWNVNRTSMAANEAEIEDDIIDSIHEIVEQLLTVALLRIPHPLPPQSSVAVISLDLLL